MVAEEVNLVAWAQFIVCTKLFSKDKQMLSEATAVWYWYTAPFML